MPSSSSSPSSSPPSSPSPLNKSHSSEEVTEQLFQRESLILSDVLANRVTLHYFQKFLEQEYSEENLLFYLEVERLRGLSDPKVGKIKALQLYRDYILPSTAVTPVNLTQEVVEEIQRKLEPFMKEELAESSEEGELGTTGSLSTQEWAMIFEKASIEAQGILERDSLPRFSKRSVFNGSLRKPRRLTNQLLQARPSIENLLPIVKKVEIKAESAPCAGVLKKRAGFFSSWKNYYYVHKGETILEYKEYKEAADLQRNPNRVIHLKNAIVRNADSLTGKENTFAIFLSTGRSFFFQASSAEEKNSWLVSLGANVTEFSGSGVSSPTSPSPPPSPKLVDLPIMEHLEKFLEGVLIVNDQNTVVAVNSSASVMFGFSANDVLGESVDLLLTKPLRVEKLLEIGATHEISARRFDNKQAFDILLTMGRLQRGHLMFTVTPKVVSPLGLNKFKSSFF